MDGGGAHEVQLPSFGAISIMDAGSTRIIFFFPGGNLNEAVCIPGDDPLPIFIQVKLSALSGF